MRHAMLIVLAGCNQIFGLSKTHPIDALPVIDVPDAQYFDTPADAPFDCPPLGGAPAFKTTLHQYAQGCSNYTESEDEHWATAVCASMIEVAKDRAAFAPLTAVTVPMAADPRLVPEGDELFVVSHPTVTISTIEAYKRDHTTDVWTHDFTVQSGLSLSANVYIGTPTSGWPRRMMVSNYVGISWEISEIEFDQSSGHAVHTYATGELVPMYFAPNLSPDGLRMYYVDSNGPMAYYDRTDLATNFTSPRQVPSAPRVAESFMTSKCARLYVYSQDLDTLFWVQQL